MHARRLADTDNSGDVSRLEFETSITQKEVRASRPREVIALSSRQRRKSSVCCGILQERTLRLDFEDFGK